MRNELLAVAGAPEEQAEEASLRPRRLHEFVGQSQLREHLEILLEAARRRGDPVDHLLFAGPPGLGKTTVAGIVAQELGVPLRITSGPALERGGDLASVLTNLEEGDVLFIDEIHRLPRVVEEFIYPAMEDFRVDIVIGDGLNARTISMPLKHFTLIGATTRSGMLSGPMRDRFKMHEHLDFYTIDELAEIVQVNAQKLKTKVVPEAARELARRSRGTPRVANARLWWARNFATSEADGEVTLPIVHRALEMSEVDTEGLDKQ
ncbi:MAG: Holliday junction branch migration DNA helicase RuvB, partial [Acidimicrobiales bacterium]